MKLIFFLFTILPCVAWAQVSEGVKAMSQGSNNALTVTLSDIRANDVDAVWKDYMKTMGNKTKYQRKEKEYFVDDASMPEISKSTVDIYSKTEESGKDVQFSVWFDLGGGYLSSSGQPDQYKAAVNVMNDFVREINRFKLNEHLKTEMNKISKMNNDLKKLVSDKDSYEKDIKKAEEKIVDAKAKIEQNIKDQAAKQAEITTQQAAIDKVKSDLDKI
jgi:hypothetical protein